MVGKVTLKRNGKIDGQPGGVPIITLAGNETSRFSFTPSFPSCDQQTEQTERIVFHYPTLEEQDCKGMELEWSFDTSSFAVYETGREVKIRNNRAPFGSTVIFSQGNVILGNKRTNYTNPACVPNFENDRLQFSVVIQPNYCDVILDFDNPLPPTINTAASTDTTVASTTDASSLSSVSLWLVIIGGSLVGILLLLGLAAFLYWFFIYRKRPPPEKSLRTQLLEAEALEGGRKEREKNEVEECQVLYNYIQKLQENKTPLWETILKEDPENNRALRQKENDEAEYRWVQRRNVAYETGEEYSTYSNREKYMEQLKENGNDVEFRKALTFVNRPVLYRRLLKEKDAAQRRYECRKEGKPVPSYSQLGLSIPEHERNIGRPMPKPMDQDWLEIVPNKE